MPIQFHALGIQPYQAVWEAMRAYTEQRNANAPDQIWLLQHPPVYTLGRNTDPRHLLNTTNIPVIEIDRGGQATYHGPGQLVVYLLLDIRRLGLGVKALIQNMETLIIALLRDFAIEAFRKDGAPGVYTRKGKIAALGLRVRRGYCYHGFSLNVKMHTRAFDGINPCGFERLPIAQIADFNPEITLPECERRLQPLLQEYFSPNR